MAKKITIRGVRRSEPDVKSFVLALLEIPPANIEPAPAHKNGIESPITDPPEGDTDIE